MDIRDFYTASAKLLASITNSDYNQLTNQLNQLVSNLTANANHPTRVAWETQLEATRQRITKVIDQMIPHDLSITEKRAFAYFNADLLFGETGRNRLNAIIAEISKNPSNAKVLMSEYNKEVQRVYQFISSFAQLSKTFPKEFIETQEINGFRLFFQKEAEIDDLVELSKVASKWNQVIIAFALLTQENDRQIKVVSAERGSLIITLAAIGVIVVSFAKGLNEILDVIIKSYEIRRHVFELKKLKIDSLQDTIDQLDDKAKINVKDTASRITSKLIEEYTIEDEGVKNEAINALNPALRHIIRFLRDGGKVEVLLTKENEGKSEVKLQLNKKNMNLIQAEDKLKEISGQDDDIELIDPPEVEDSEDA